MAHNDTQQHAGMQRSGEVKGFLSATCRWPECRSVFSGLVFSFVIFWRTSRMPLWMLCVVLGGTNWKQQRSVNVSARSGLPRPSVWTLLWLVHAEGTMREVFVRGVITSVGITVCPRVPTQNCFSLKHQSVRLLVPEHTAELEACCV